MLLNKNCVTEFIVTFGYVGKIKFAPGTFGSLAALPLAYLIINAILKYQIIWFFEGYSLYEQQVISVFYILGIMCLALFLIGTYYSSLYIAYTGKTDPSEVVIDEVVGQLLTITLCLFSVPFVTTSKLAEHLDIKIIEFILLIFLPLCLFRFFDIIKPWPINWLDKNVQGGIGVMLDDVLAALFAAVVQYVIIFMLINPSGY